jgi:HD superfamily phosphohydrolase
VANKRNSIDVDKFDYLLRDAYHIGYKDQSFDYKTIMKNSLVVEGEICYNSKVKNKLIDGNKSLRSFLIKISHV